MVHWLTRCLSNRSLFSGPNNGDCGIRASVRYSALHWLLLCLALTGLLAGCRTYSADAPKGEDTMASDPGRSGDEARPLADTTPEDRNGMFSHPPEMQIDPSAVYVATITTAKGDIVVELDAAAAPQTANNFVFLAEQGFYDGLTFHRVEPGFVIQGGDPTGTGSGGPGYTVPAEIELTHVEGAIAMARLSDQVNPSRASSGSQFYITLAPTPFLDGAYTAFGRVTEGMHTVTSISVGDVIEQITISTD
jgi:peptidyl-prolyl cis-trans isomerase B (cyclophilin B)